MPTQEGTHFLAHAPSTQPSEQGYRGAPTPPHVSMGHTLWPQQVVVPLGGQPHLPPVHGAPLAQLPHEPPQPSSPHTLPSQFAMQARHLPAVHATPWAQLPHAPPQPSSPHSLSLHAGLQQPFRVGQAAQAPPQQSP